jgi:hypothetical protein
VAATPSRRRPASGERRVRPELRRRARRDPRAGDPAAHARWSITTTSEECRARELVVPPARVGSARVRPCRSAELGASETRGRAIGSKPRWLPGRGQQDWRRSVSARCAPRARAFVCGARAVRRPRAAGPRRERACGGCGGAELGSTVTPTGTPPDGATSRRLPCRGQRASRRHRLARGDARARCPRSRRQRRSPCRRALRRTRRELRQKSAVETPPSPVKNWPRGVG